MQSCFNKNIISYYKMTDLAKCVRYLRSKTIVANGISFVTHSREGYLQLLHYFILAYLRVVHGKSWLLLRWLRERTGVQIWVCTIATAVTVSKLGPSTVNSVDDWSYRKGHTRAVPNQPVESVVCWLLKEWDYQGQYELNQTRLSWSV